MRNRIRYILLIILLAVSHGAAGQGYVIDSVCLGAERHYRIDGEVGSTYKWTLTDPFGIVFTLPETADTVTIIWNMGDGDYILSTRQTSIHGCDTIELGIIKVFEVNPSTTDISICTNLVPYIWNGNRYATAGTYSVTLQSVSGCDSIATLNLIVNPAVTTTTDISICNNQLPYIWNGNSYALAGTYSVTLQSALGCDSVATLNLKVNPAVIPSINILANSNPICSGTIVTFTATISNGGINPVYQWMKNGNITGTNNSTYNDSNIVNNDHITCMLISDVECASSDSTFSNEIIMEVMSSVAPSISISVNNNPICSGTMVTFTATVTSGGSDPVYQWMKNSIKTGTNAPTYNDNNLVNNDNITCTYTSTDGCAGQTSITSNLIKMTVNPLLTPTIVIASNQNPVCQGAQVTFTSNITNGGSNPVYQWKKNGLDVGTNSQIYSSNTFANNDVVICKLTSSDGCSNPSTATSNQIKITVNPLLTPTITIAANQNPVCQGAQVIFTSNITNGGSSPVYHWKKNGLDVGTNSPVYQGNSFANNDVISCSLTPNGGCSTIQTVLSNEISLTVIVSPAPAISIAAYSNPICAGSRGIFIASTSNGGNNPVYQWKKNGVNVGFNSPVYTDEVIVNNDVIRCSLTSNESCTGTSIVLSNPITMTVTPLLTTTISISADHNPICIGTLVTFTAVSTNQGSNPFYQWKKNGIIAGTNASIYSDNALANNDIITCKLTSNAVCVYPDTTISESIIMKVNPLLTPTISISADQNTICSGTPVTFTAMATNQGSNPVYQWEKNGIIVGTNASIYTDNALANNDIITCKLTSNAICATPDPIISESITMSVTPLLTPSISISADMNSICAGTLVTFTATATNKGSNPVYQWKKNGIIAGTNDSIYTDSGLANNDIITCRLTSNATCAYPSVVTSNPITMMVNPLLTPTIAVLADQNPICDGVPVTFTATATNQGDTSIYQWMKNGILTGTNESTYYDNILINGDVISCKLTSNATCATPNTAISEGITMTVNPLVTPTININADQNPICAGTLVTFAATATNQGNNPIYEWEKNGIIVGTNASIYTDNSLANNDIITCKLASNATCADPSVVTSEPITMTVNPLLTPTIAITENQNTICFGTLVIFTATATNQGSNPVYEWKKNGIIVGTNASIYTDNALANNDIITCKLTSNATCATPDTVLSNPVIMTVYPLLTPTIAITANQNPICAGTLVIFTAMAINQGITPVYQWKKNGIIVGANASKYTDSDLANNDIITCKLTSSATCATPDTAVSENITMTVYPLLTPAIAITADQNPICSGTPVVFNATATNQGSNPVYQWMKNGILTGTNESTYHDITLINGDVISCKLTSNATCATPDTAISEGITMTVNPLLTPTININPDQNPICAGTLVTFTATATNQGSNPVYQWKKNEIIVGVNDAIYADSTLANNDIINCKLFSNATCATPDTAISENITMTVNPTFTPTISILADQNPICEGTPVTFTAKGANYGNNPIYEWMKNGISIRLNDSIYTDSALVNNDVITCILTSNEGCANPGYVTSNITIIVNPPLNPAITIEADPNPVCRGTLVRFTSNVVFPGTNPVYQWLKNGVIVGTNDSVYTDSLLYNNDVINCILTSSEKCAVSSTKMSSGIIIIVKDPPLAEFTFSEYNQPTAGQIQLNNISSGADSYYWDFGNGQTSEEENPTANYSREGNYLIMLVAMNEYNCTDTAWNKYLIEFYGLYIPNAFAPESKLSPANLFKPVGARLIKYRIEVYDSWGHLLWESTKIDSEGSPSEAWDGTYNGILMPQGTYMWKVEAIFNDNTVWQGCDIGFGKGKNIGTVTLIR